MCATHLDFKLSLQGRAQLRLDRHIHRHLDFKHHPRDDYLLALGVVCHRVVRRHILLRPPPSHDYQHGHYYYSSSPCC
eukprot:6586204-Alexandrium_andersonii.AAC.1